MGGYLRAVKRSAGLVVTLWDQPENILERITFYDIDSRPIERRLTPGEKRLYLREIKKDMTYFGKTYARAHLRIDITGLDVEAAARRVKESVEVYAAKAARRRSPVVLRARWGRTSRGQARRLRDGSSPRLRPPAPL